MEKNIRTYGKPPYKAALIHGGPGAAGYMSSVAKNLLPEISTLEPLQTALSLEGQILELKNCLQKSAVSPIILIGHSWGAWLAYFVAARFPERVKKLILVSSGAFVERYTKNLMKKRLSRLSIQDLKKFYELQDQLQTANINNKNEIFTEFGRLMSKAESYDAFTEEDSELSGNFNIYNKIWPEAEQLRLSGQLLKVGRDIKCRVIALHGDYDSIPGEGVREPLEKVIEDFQFILLKECGHYPWRERRARDQFYEIIRKELLTSY